MLTQPHEYDHHTPSSSAIHDAYILVLLVAVNSVETLPLKVLPTVGAKAT